MNRRRWTCGCGVVNTWVMATCEVCGAVKPAEGPAAAPRRATLPQAYQAPPERPPYVEPTEAEHREIRIKLGETMEKLAVSMTSPGRGILHERGMEKLSYEGEWPSRFANDGERQAEATRQLEAFKVWQEGVAP